MVKNTGERILDSLLLILLESRHQFHGLVVNVLYHEDESVIVIVICLCAAEDELDPDKLAFKITHHAVVRRCTAGREILLQVFRIRAAQELLLVLRPDHVDDHHSPVGILEVVVNNVIGDLRNVDAARRVCNEVNVHREQVSVLDRVDLLGGKGFLQ